MAWGGKRPGSGRKKIGTAKAPQRAAPKMPVRETVPAEPIDTTSPAIHPSVWMEMLPQLEAISKQYARNKTRQPEMNPFRLPDFPAKAIPTDKSMQMAMDSFPGLAGAGTAWLAGAEIGGLAGEGLLFLGYTYLAELAQRPEYRVMSETIADDATREWIDFDVTGDETEKKDSERRMLEDPAGERERLSDPDEKRKRLAAKGKLDKVKALRDDQLRLQVKDRFYEQMRNDGFFGRTHLFIDLGQEGGPDADPNELASDIGDGRSQLSRTKCPKGHFRALRTIEPVWTYPLAYNAINPLRKDWYNPQVWYVMGQQIHGSRLLCFIGHPVPDMLKPAYAFGGLSLSQMAKPYVDNWLTTRTSVGQLIHSFSVMVLMTDLSTLMQPNNASALLARVAMFNMLRDNQGTFVLNEKTEDFKNVSASLAGLHELQAQAQEHMASVSRIPLVKFTGIQPAGLNASSEGEIKVYDDTIMAYQSRFASQHLTTVVNFEQLHLFGEVDPEITWHWNTLRVMTEKEKGEKQKAEAERDQIYVNMGALDNAEVRKRIADDPELPYADIDPDDVPEPPPVPGNETFGGGDDDEGGDKPGENGEPKREKEPVAEPAE